MRIANQSALLMQKNDLYFHLIAIIFTSVLSGLYLRGKGWQHCQTSMKLEHSSQLMEHCKDKLPTPAWLWFLSYCTQHLSHILILSTAFSWPTQRDTYVFWGNGIFFLFSFTKTQNRRKLWCCLFALPQDNYKIYIPPYISMDGTGWVKSENFSLAQKAWERERNDWFFCPACTGTISVVLSKVLYLQRPVQCVIAHLLDLCGHI